jgi:hypothetical protein
MQTENDKNQPTLVDYTLDVPVDELDGAGEVVVTLRFSDGSQRETTFLVPDAFLPGLDVPELLLYGRPDVILVEEISVDVIQRALDYIAEVGALMDCSVPL